MLRTRRAQILLVVVGAAILAALFGGIRYLVDNAGAHVSVFSPTDQRVTITVDSTAPYRLAPGFVFGRDIAHGAHTVRLESGGVRVVQRVEVEHGGVTWVVPFGEQCFATIDISESAYSGRHGAPRLLRRQRGSAPFQTEPDAYVGAVPPTRSGNQSVAVVRLVPCEDLALSDDELAQRYAER